MKSNIFFFIWFIIISFLFFSCSGNSQNKKSKITQETQENDICYHRSNIDFNTIDLYKNVARIELQAWQGPFNMCDEVRIKGDTSSPDPCEPFDEHLDLNSVQKDSLFKLLTGYNKHGNLEAASCYDPRHRILFFNKANEEIGYIDLCFDCGNTRTNLKLFDIICESQLKDYQNFLKWCGIKKGFKSFI